MRKKAPHSEPTRERLLNAAERLFAERGFDGVSLRAIAACGGAQLALLHYHFGSKLSLYRAVWVRRFEKSGIRYPRLERSEIDFARPASEVVRELVELLIGGLQSLSEEPSGRDFLAILSREATDPREMHRGLNREFADPTIRMFLKAFQRALPQLTAAEIESGLAYTVWVIQNRFGQSGRMVRLSGDVNLNSDLQQNLPTMIDFIVGGWLQLQSAKSSLPRKAASTRRSRK